MDKNTNKYVFLFKKTKIPKGILGALFKKEEFYNEINKIYQETKTVSDLDVYEILAELFFPMLQQIDTDGFKESYKKEYGMDSYKSWMSKFSSRQRAIKQISKSLFPDNPNKWLEDFEEYKKRNNY